MALATYGYIISCRYYRHAPKVEYQQVNTNSAQVSIHNSIKKKTFCLWESIRQLSYGKADRIQCRKLLYVMNRSKTIDFQNINTFLQTQVAQDIISSYMCFITTWGKFIPNFSYIVASSGSVSIGTLGTLFPPRNREDTLSIAELSWLILAFKVCLVFCILK